MTSGSASSLSCHGTAPPHPLLFPGVIPRLLQVLPMLSTLPAQPCSQTPPQGPVAPGCPSPSSPAVTFHYSKLKIQQHFPQMTFPTKSPWQQMLLAQSCEGMWSMESVSPQTLPGLQRSFGIFLIPASPRRCCADQQSRALFCL